jgi:hypothetical protein
MAKVDVGIGIPLAGFIKDGSRREACFSLYDLMA